MGCTSLSRFESTLKPPQCGKGYDRPIALTLAEQPPRDLVDEGSSPYSSVCEILVSTPTAHKAQFSLPETQIDDNSRYSHWSKSWVHSSFGLRRMEGEAHRGLNFGQNSRWAVCLYDVFGAGTDTAHYAPIP
jgi:hypothetical protein